MRTTTKTSVLLPLLSMAVATSCVGHRARTNVLLPAMRQAWPGVRADAEQSPTLNDHLVLDEFEASLNEGAALAVFTQWPMIQFHALEGINHRVESGSIGEGVAASLRERVRQFDQSVSTLGRRSR